MSEQTPASESPDIGLKTLQHLIPILALLCLWTAASVRVDSFLVHFAIGSAFVVGASVLIASLAALYSRNKSASLFALRSRNIAWALTLVLLISVLPEYITTPHKRTMPQEVKVLTPIEPSSQVRATSLATTPTATVDQWPLNPDGRSMLTKMRAEYPSLKDSSDEEVVRAVHKAFYEDLPLQQVAAKFGMRLVK